MAANTIRTKITYLGFAACVLLLACQTEIPNKKAITDSLAENCIRLETLDPSDPDTRDLEFLKEHLKGVDILMLGEISHTDGSSLQAKSRLVKFLHREMNFDVLVFESGLFECSLAWEEFLKGDVLPDSAFARGIFPAWAKSIYLQDLVSYIGVQARSDRPLELAGMDIQPTGNLNTTARREIYNHWLMTIDSSLSFGQFKHLNRLFDDPANVLRNAGTADSVEMDSIYAELAELADLFSKADSLGPEYRLLRRHFLNLGKFLTFMMGMGSDNIDPAIANIRDEGMAENLIWLKENLYPGKKIMVWGANSHLLHNRHLLAIPDKMYPMGEVIKARYGQRCYVIGFTCFAGELGSIMRDYIQKVPMASNKGFEYLMHEAGFRYAFLDADALPAEALLGKEFVARFLGYSNLKAEWGRMFDGFLYIDIMQPNRSSKTEAHE